MNPQNPPTLHPELIELETRYNDLVDAVQEGAMKIDDAMGALAEMRIPDGTGALWGMSPEGDFISGMPGGPLEVTEPYKFRPGQLPAHANPIAPWENQDLLSPPTGDHLRQGAGASPFPQGLNQLPMNLQNPADEFEEDYEDYEEDTPKYKPLKKNKNKQKAQNVGGLAGGALGALTSFGDSLKNSGLGKKVADNKRTVIFILAALLIVGGLYFFNSQEETGDIPQSSTGQDLTEMPLDNSGAPAAETPAEPPADAPVPDQGKVNALVSALVSGDRSLAGAAINEPGDAATIAINTAAYSSFKEGNGGLKLTAGPPAAAEGGAVADLKVTDASSGETIKTVKVNLVKTPEGMWVLASWPKVN